MRREWLANTGVSPNAKLVHLRFNRPIADRYNENPKRWDWHIYNPNYALGISHYAIVEKE